MKHGWPLHGSVRATQSPSFPSANLHDCPALVHVSTGSLLFLEPVLSGGQPHSARSAAAAIVRIRGLI